MKLNLIEKSREIANAILYKLPTVLSMCLIILAFYVFYTVFISYNRTHQVSGVYSKTQRQSDLVLSANPVDMRENFGTAFDSCVSRGYETDFCLRSENMYSKRENISL